MGLVDDSWADARSDNMAKNAERTMIVLKFLVFIILVVVSGSC